MAAKRHRVGKKKVWRSASYRGYEIRSTHKRGGWVSEVRKGPWTEQTVSDPISESRAVMKAKRVIDAMHGD